MLASTLAVVALTSPLPRRDALRLASAVAGGSLAPALLPAGAAAPSFATCVTLSDGLVFPLASFGLQVYDDATAEKLTRLAIDAGFRNFFASVLAGNQRGFARGVKASGIPRDELFICGSVVSNRAQDAETAYKLTKLGCDENLEAFAVGGIEKLDMIMLDYPGPDCECIRGQWRAFEDMKAAGRTRSLAVSNFVPAQLDCLLKDPKLVTRPTVNQLPYCVGYHDPGVVGANRKRGIHVQAWSPLGNGRLTRFSRDKAKAMELCAEIGAAYSKSAAQVALRFITQNGASYTMQTKSATHFAEDGPGGIFDFELSKADMTRLEGLNVQPSWEGSITEA